MILKRLHFVSDILHARLIRWEAQYITQTQSGSTRCSACGRQKLMYAKSLSRGNHRREQQFNHYCCPVPTPALYLSPSKAHQGLPRISINIVIRPNLKKKTVQPHHLVVLHNTRKHQLLHAEGHRHKLVRLSPFKPGDLRLREQPSRNAEARRTAGAATEAQRQGVSTSITKQQTQTSSRHV